jgi:hypothetical protein
MNYTFYLPGIDKLTGISQEDWQFLSEQAEENGVLPATLAARIIANELAMWRDQIHYANMKEAEQANQEMNLEKLVEESVT